MDINESQNPSPEQFREGKVAKAIEQQTAKLPSDVYLWAAGGSILVSLITQLRQPRRMSFFNVPSRTGQLSLFFGQWAPVFLLLGIYNKIIKAMGGSDRATVQQQDQGENPSDVVTH